MDQVVSPGNKRLIILVSILTSLSITLAFNLLSYGLPSRAAEFDSEQDMLTEITTTELIPFISNLTGTDSYNSQYDFYDIDGYGFNENSVVMVSGVPAPETIFVSPAQLVVGVATGTTDPDMLFVANYSADFTTLIASNMVAFVQPGAIPAAPPVPTLNATTANPAGLVPNAIDAMSGDAPVTVNGTNFTDSTTVHIRRAGPGAITWIPVNVAGRDLPGVLNITLGPTISWVPGNYAIRVCNGNGNCSNERGFTVRAVAPTITNIAADVQTVGNPPRLLATVTVTGTGFMQNSVVAVNGVPQNRTIISSTQLTLQGAPGPAGTTIRISVTNPNGSSTSRDFTWSNYAQPAPGTGPTSPTAPRTPTRP